MVQKVPEVLAPVGNMEMCKAAVHNGADAVYVGLPNFNARGRAELFTLDGLREMISFCHLYGVKVFIAANILIFEQELEEIEQVLYDVIPLGIDAFIVQDIGLIRLIKKIAPDQAVHGSTQMTVSNAEAILFTEDLSIHRYVLARENTITEIKNIREKTDKELEVFVHGALCVAYSGQCLTSEAFGGRSANRGQCAQACRQEYDLIVDGEVHDLKEKRYLVSPKDLCGIDEVPALIEASVDSFKIEGRLKSPSYVADTVRQYREKIFQGDKERRRDDLSLVYSRGFFSGWLHGVDHQKLVDGRYSNHHGIEFGTVIAIGKKGVTISKTYPSYRIAPGDGILFEDFLDQQRIGGSVFTVQDFEDKVTLSFSSEFDTAKLHSGMTVFVNASSRLEKSLERSWTVKDEMKKIPLSFVVEGAENERLAVTVHDERGNVFTEWSSVPLQLARNSPVTIEDFKKELGALSGTPFILRELIFKGSKNVFVNNKELKIIRQKLVSMLTKKRTAVPTITLSDRHEVAHWKKIQLSEGAEGSAGSPQLNLLIRDTSQLEAVSKNEVHTVYLDYEFGKDYSRSVEVLRWLGVKVGIATTRILKPGELGHLKVIERLKPDCILARNLGALQFFKEKDFPLIADFSLNITNSLSASWFLEKGISRICASYDLNSEQLLDLLRAHGGGTFEVTIHQYMPAFHMEHCVFAAFLSSGSSFRDCGKPCERHRVELRDIKGAKHPLKADAECRNTMFHGKAQSAARLIPDLLRLGLKHFRVEALFETASQLQAKIRAYRALIDGKDSIEEIQKELGTVEQYGVTEGQLFNIRRYQDRRKDSQTLRQMN